MKTYSGGSSSSLFYGYRNLDKGASLNALFDENTLRGDSPQFSDDILSATADCSDPIWNALRGEAAQECSAEPELARLYATIFEAGSFEQALAYKLALKLGHPSLPSDELKGLLLEPVLSDASIGEAARADISAIVERDPAASGRLLEPFLFFKGYAAIQTHRIAHWFWNAGRRNLALYLQSRSSEVFQTDIHPGARVGKAIFLDHATGFVAGETAVIEDNVSILHGVTLGGTGTAKTSRHPKVRTGVLIGAGAQLIGDIEIGAYSKIAAGSFVTQSIPARCTAVGVPARIIEGTGSASPAQSMEQGLELGAYESFTYVI